MAGSITVAKFRDVADGLQKGQFAVGDRVKIKGLSDLDPIYKALLDRPITVTLGLIGPDGRIGLTPMWFDYEGDKVLVNTASHRAKCDWIRKNPKLTILVVNPENAYHWVQLKCTVEREERRMRRRAASASRSSSTRSGRNTPATRRPTGCAIPRSTRSASCSSATSIASRPSASPDQRPPWPLTFRGGVLSSWWDASPDRRRPIPP